MLIIIAESSRKRPKLSHHPVNAGLTGGTGYEVEAIVRSNGAGGSL
jgi:hypothetical protein